MVNYTELCNILHFFNRTEADSETNLKCVKECDLVLFSGGKQLKISTLMGGTQLLEVIIDRYSNEKKFVVAGTSADAAAMSDTMIISGSSREALIKGTLELTNGLSLINEVTIDTHFVQRGRMGRLIQTVACNPGILGLGLGEDTSVIIKNNIMEVNGSGLVIIVDGHEITFYGPPRNKKWRTNDRRRSQSSCFR